MENLIPILISALLLLFLEIFVPGGILGGIAILLLVISSIMIGNDYGLEVGLVMFLLTLLVAFGMFCLEMRILGRSPYLRWLRTEGRVTGSTNPIAARAGLLNQTGRTVTALTPAGKVEIGGHLYEAATAGPSIPPNTAITVKKVEAFRIVVMPLEVE